MDLNNKHIFFAVSSMGLGHVHRSLPIINYLLASGSQLTILGCGRALEILKLELNNCPGIEYLEFEDYPPIQRGRGIAHYVCFLKDLLETGSRIRKETAFLKSLMVERDIDLIFSDGRFGFVDKRLPCFLVCHQIRFILPRWLRIFQPLSDLGQYLLLRKFTKIIVPDFADPDINLAGQLSHNWMSRKLDTIYIGFLSSVKKTRASKTIDILFITGGFIEAERLRIVNWAKQRLTGLAHKGDPEQVHIRHSGGSRNPVKSSIWTPAFAGVTTCSGSPKVVFVLGEVGRRDNTLEADNRIETYACAYGEKRNELLNAARVLVGRTGYTTLMDICELGLCAALTPTANMTEQKYLAKHIAHWNHPLPVDIAGENGLAWFGIDGTALPASIRNWSTEQSLKCLAGFIAELDHG